MKKTLGTFAILAVSGVASAQSNVTIYGVVDTTLAYERNGVASITAMYAGSQNSNRIGFKGIEDLGGGLSTSFVLESGFAVDTGAFQQGGLLFGRQAWIGLNGGFGSVRFGRQYTPIVDLYTLIDPMVFGMVGSLSNFAPGAAAGGPSAGLGGAGMLSLFSTGSYRENNAIEYAFEKNGFSTKLAYSLGEVAGSVRSGSELGLFAGYSVGQLYVGYGYDNQYNATATNSKVSHTIGSTYDFGEFKLHGAWETNKGSASTVADVNNTDWMVGVSVPVGPHRFLVSRVWNKNRVAANTNSAQTGIAYQYWMSKTTDIYASYTKSTNQSRASINAAGLGLTDNLIQVGIDKKF